MATACHCVALHRGSILSSPTCGVSCPCAELQPALALMAEFGVPGEEALGVLALCPKIAKMPQQSARSVVNLLRSSGCDEVPRLFPGSLVEVIAAAAALLMAWSSVSRGRGCGCAHT